MKNTVTEYKTLSDAYDFFNRILFAGQLPEVLITLNRKRGMAGYYWQEKFHSRIEKGMKLDEIALNPDTFCYSDDSIILSTLVHEMVHVWQAHFGNKSRNGYHNQEWADKMESIGLMPSNTGAPGGKRTGQKMADYVIQGGAFDKFVQVFLSNGARLNWQSYDLETLLRNLGNDKDKDPEKEKEVEDVKRKVKKNKVKYTCPSCKTNIWGKPELNVVCGDCDQRMVEAA